MKERKKSIFLHTWSDADTDMDTIIKDYRVNPGYLNPQSPNESQQMTNFKIEETVKYISYQFFLF